MNTRFSYPVIRLFPRITEDLQKYPSVDLRSLIENGTLNNEILQMDTCGKCTDVAEVIQHNDETTMAMHYTVRISVAYCQFLWIICDIAIKTIDRLIALGEAAKNGMTKEALIEANKELLRKSESELKALLQSYDLSDVADQLQTHVHRMNELLNDEHFYENIGKELALGMSLLPEENMPLKLERFLRLNMNMNYGYGHLANSCCVKGITFTLLHEVGHIVLNHFSHAETMDDEKEADAHSFWTIYSEVPEAERFTANVGIICMLFSLLVKDFDKPRDGVHPREDRRLLSIFDNITVENEKYRWLTAYLFCLWAQIKRKQDFPEIYFTEPTAIDQIKAYFNRYSVM